MRISVWVSVAALTTLLGAGLLMTGVVELDDGKSSPEKSIRKCDRIIEQSLAEVDGFKLPIRVGKYLKTKKALEHCRVAVTMHPENPAYNLVFGLIAGFHGDAQWLGYVWKANKKGYFPALLTLFSASTTQVKFPEKPSSKLFAAVYEHKSQEIRLGAAHMLLTSGVEMKLAEKIFQSLIVEGHVEAMVTLAGLYEKGSLGEVPPDKYISLYKRAAEAEDLYSMYRYAQCLIRANFCEKDLDNGYRIMLSAAKKGHKGAQHNLAEMSERGLIKFENMDEDLKWKVIAYGARIARSR